MINCFTNRVTCLLLLLLSSFTIQAQLTANFNSNTVSGCAPLLVNFSDQSTGNPTQWKWDLGNGTISFLQNPSVSYFNSGNYTIKLVVKNAGGADSVVKTQYIKVSAKPTVQFTADKTSGCYPLPVQFTDQSTAGNDTITTWQWDFGDGFSSSQANPLHVYNTSGNYNVTLRVINSKGCLNTFSRNQYIQIDAGVKAGFTNSVPNVCSAPVTINFQNTSTGTGVLGYEWLFGDGTGSTAMSPSHAYTTPGSYSVKLVVTNATGCTDTIVKTNAFTVGNVFPKINADTTVCVGSPLVITNGSLPLPSSSTWYFGDGTSSAQNNPVKTYNTPGSYQIKLVANFGSCLDSAFKTVKVLPKPTAAFTVDDSTNCSNLFTVNFTDHSIGASSYKWDFGDNTTATDPNPSHTYGRYGSFTVTLVVTSANGCMDTLKKQSYIKVLAPKITFTNLADSGCVPFTKKFTSTINAVDPVTGYLWDFGDGATSTSASPTHTYTTQGVFAVKLIITTAGGCADTAIIQRGIITNSRPVATFSATPRDACAKMEINFTDLSTGNPSKWLWDFGDGSGSFAPNPKHTYHDTGYYDITLVVWNSGCPDTVKYTDYVHINVPIARFIESFTCTRPLERTFTNSSIGADEWQWDFGDGTSSTQLSPTHIYAVPGNYIVALTVKNNTAGCDFTKQLPIQIVDVKPSFFASDTVVCKGTNIIFNTNLSLAEVVLFSWDFGDGIAVSSSTSNSIAHLYAASGNYNVRLITTDILGCKDTLSKPAYIRIDGPTAKFTSSVPGSCLNSLVSFNDASKDDNVHPIQTWSWNYGDGIKEVLSAAPYQHNYATAGAYTVTLKVTDSKGCTDSANIPTALIISQPVAKFTPVDSVSCPTKQIRFTSQSTGPGLTYLWNFGDGLTAATQNPVHNYAADGTYAVKLFIKDQYGCTDSISKPAIVSIVTPVANFTMSDSFSICPPLIVQFTNLSQHAVTQNWNFGDGTSASIVNPSHFYNYPGIYTVTLTVTSKGGCTSVMKKDIVVNGPKGTFTYTPTTGCNPVKIDFLAKTQDRISFIWDFNDGATVSTLDSVISHTYTNAGVYVPKMILFDANGCQVPITGKDTIIVSDIKADFNFLDKPLCDNGTVLFKDSSVSNDIITGYSWSFGDGKTSTAQNPQHLYTATGIYYPKVTVTTRNGCVDSIRSVRPVKVVASPQISMTSTANGCTPLAASFKGIINVPDTSALSWSWDFGNGSSSTIQNPSVQNFTTAGIYSPFVIATNSSGCKDTAVKSIEAYKIPAVYAGLDTTICNKVGVRLQASGAANYSWSPAAGLSCINCANPVATPDSVRRYVVKGTSLQGCSASDTVQVKVQYPFKLKYSSTDTLCKGQNVKLFASGTDQYVWSPSKGLNNTNTALPIGTPDTTTTYRVIGTDNWGCFKDTGYVLIKVFPVPTVDAGADKTINIGQSIDLVPIISADVTSVIWTPTGSIFRNTYPAISIKPKQNTEYTVEARNPGGCMARDQVSVFVLCNGSNVFIPNTFSPNGDGANDIFYPRGTGLFKIKTLRLYNRWGEVVFEKNSFNPNDPSSGWDGTFKGVKLGSDVFVYMIDIICDNNSILTYKGNVALLQ